MPEYYYLHEKRQLGPFSLDDLQKQSIHPETMVWHKGLPEWVTASTLKEIKLALPHQPPPLPPAITQDKSEIKAPKSLEEPSATLPGKIKPYRWIVGWIAFHALALILSLKEIKLFNATGEPKPEKFWPFVKFTNPFFDTTYNRTFVLFNGIFTQYDWTEFSFYASGSVFFVILIIVYKKSS